jgi:hypothetical protein
MALDQGLRMMMLPEMRTDAHSPQSCPMKIVPTIVASVQSVGRSIGCAAEGSDEPSAIRKANMSEIALHRSGTSAPAVRRNM